MVNKTIEFKKCGEQKYIFKLEALDYCGAYCTGKFLSLNNIKYFWQKNISFVIKE